LCIEGKTNEAIRSYPQAAIYWIPVAQLEYPTGEAHQLHYKMFCLHDFPSLIGEPRFLHEVCWVISTFFGI